MKRVEAKKSKAYLLEAILGYLISIVIIVVVYLKREESFNPTSMWIFYTMVFFYVMMLTIRIIPTILQEQTVITEDEYNFYYHKTKSQKIKIPKDEILIFKRFYHRQSRYYSRDSRYGDLIIYTKTQQIKIRYVDHIEEIITYMEMSMKQYKEEYA